MPNVLTCAVPLWRAQTLSLAFLGAGLTGSACISAGHMLDLLAFDDPGPRLWDIGTATAASVASLWGMAGAHDSTDSDAIKMLDASELGSEARWFAGTIARWGSATTLGLLCLLYTFVLRIAIGSGAGSSRLGAAFVVVVAAAAAACFWARALGAYVAGGAAALIAFALWLTGQALSAAPVSSVLPLPASRTTLSLRDGLGVLALLAALSLAAVAGIERRRSSPS